MAPRSGRRADDSRCWHHCDVSNNYCRTVSKTGRRRRILSMCNSFWVLVCVVIVNNCKPARPPLGGHQEVNTHAYTIYWHSNLLTRCRYDVLCFVTNEIGSDHQIIEIMMKLWRTTLSERCVNCSQNDSKSVNGRVRKHWEMLQHHYRIRVKYVRLKILNAKKHS